MEETLDTHYERWYGLVMETIEIPLDQARALYAIIGLANISDTKNFLKKFDIDVSPHAIFNTLHDALILKDAVNTRALNDRLVHHWSRNP